MPWGDVLDNAIGLLVYPGAVAALLLGAIAEIGATWALVPERGGLRPAARSVLAVLPGSAARGFPTFSLLAALLALVACLQMAAPFNPVPAGDRNLLIAAFALIAAAWLTWTWGWSRGELDPRLVLTVQACWLVALLVPAVVPQNFHPQALGNSAFPSAVPTRAACLFLYLMCLPALLNLIPEAAPQGVPGGPGRRLPGIEAAGFGLLRIVLWLPYCGLFASLFFAPSSDDVLGIIRFLVIVLGCAMVSVAISLNLIYRGARFTRRFYFNVVAPFAIITVALGMVLALLGPK